MISIIITTRNEENNIGNCLQSIFKQSYPQDQIEILVVDNASTDKTKEIASKYTRNVFDKGPERSAQRNFGVNQSKGKYFLYLDADMALSKNVVQSCVERVQQHPEMVGFYISEIVKGDAFFSRVRRFERSFYDGTVIDCARFINRSIFLNLGGFDESMCGPEDWDLDKRLKEVGNIGLINSPIYHNEEEFYLGKYLSKKSYYAKSFDVYIKKWGQDDQDLRKQLGLYCRYFGVFFENGKWKKVLSAPHLAIGMYFLRFLVGVTYLLNQKRVNL